MPTEPRGRIARKLVSITSVEELDEVLRAIAADPRNRWKRTAILSFVPDGFKRIAEGYFSGEALDPPRRKAPNSSSVVPVLEIEEALERVRGLEAIADVEAQRDQAVDWRGVEIAIDDGGDAKTRVGKILAALKEEIAAADKAAPKRYRLSSGRCVGARGHEFVYVFDWSSEPDLFAPGELLVDRLKCPARVGRQCDGEKRFELLTDEQLDDLLPHAVFRVDPTFLLRALYLQIKQIDAARDDAERAAAELLLPPSRTEAGVAEADGFIGLNDQQKVAISMVSRSRRSYVWGPPGTGKTRTLGTLIMKLAREGQRVLVISPYNIAVDEAVLAAAEASDLDPGTIVRFGRVSDRVRRAGLDLDNLLEARAAASGLTMLAQQVLTALEVRAQMSVAVPSSVRGILEELGSRAIALRRAGERALAADIARAAKVLYAHFRAPEAEILAAARVVATTFTLFSVSPLVRNRPFDRILVDEASVLRTPEAVVTLVLAGCPVSFFGDPRQLPPIVNATSPAIDEWFRRNPFELAGIKKPEDAVGACVMLRAQYRMAPPIRQLVSTFFYDGALEDGLCPAKGTVALFDTSDTPAEMTTRYVRMRPSKVNLIHRTIVFAILEHAVRQFPSRRFLVLSPFLAQRRAFESEARARGWKNVRFATVHASQGTEADIVILDTVLAPGRARPRFLDDLRNRELPNLLNVGLSRAKHGLIVVAHRREISRKLPGRLLERIVRYIEESATTINVPADMKLNAAVRQLDHPAVSSDCRPAALTRHDSVSSTDIL